MSEQAPQDILDQPVYAADDHIRHRFDELGYGESPTLRQMQQYVLEQFEHMKLPDAFGLMLGRTVSSGEVANHFYLHGVSSNLAVGRMSPDAAFKAMVEAKRDMPEVFDRTKSV